MIVQASGGDFKPIPEGSYTAICVRLIDLGTQVTTYQGTDKTQRKVLIAWEIPEVDVEYEGEIKPALIMSRYTASLSDKATLRKHLEAWRGRKFTDDELRGFDLANVLGKGCLMQVLHTESGGNTYANIAAIMAMPKGSVTPTPHHPLINFDLDAYDAETYLGLSPKLRETIQQSPEFKHATGQLIANGKPASGNVGGPDLDDEIPFATCDMLAEPMGVFAKAWRRH